MPRQKSFRRPSLRCRREQTNAFKSSFCSRHCPHSSITAWTYPSDPSAVEAPFLTIRVPSLLLQLFCITEHQRFRSLSTISPTLSQFCAREFIEQLVSHLVLRLRCIVVDNHTVQIRLATG